MGASRIAGGQGKLREDRRVRIYRPLNSRAHGGLSVGPTAVLVRLETPDMGEEAIPPYRQLGRCHGITPDEKPSQ